jgi:hypothetical protein
MWESRRLTTLWAFTAYYRDSFTVFLHSVAIGPGAHSLPYCMGTSGVFSRGKAVELEADNIPQSNAEIKNAWSYTSPPTNVFKAWFLINHKDFVFNKRYEYTKEGLLKILVGRIDVCFKS